MRRASLLGAALVFALALPQGASAQSQPPAMTPVPADSAAVVATVDGTDVRRADIEMFYRSLPPQFQQIPIDAIFPQLVERYIDQRLVANAARKAGLAEREDVKQQIALVTEGLLNQTYMEERLRDQVSDAKLREEYQKAVALESKREEIRARHILLKDRESAATVIAELRAGADFADLAAKKGTDPTARSGGDLGFFPREQMVPAFSEAAFKLKPGEITSEPVQTQFGWHVIKVEERRVAGQRSFEEMAEELRQNLSEKAYQEVVSDLRSKAKVEIRGAQKIQPLR